MYNVRLKMVMNSEGTATRPMVREKNNICPVLKIKESRFSILLIKDSGISILIHIFYTMYLQTSNKEPRNFTLFFKKYYKSLCFNKPKTALNNFVESFFGLYLVIKHVLA